MKAILITSEESFSNNYGAVLQGYALYHILSSSGYKVEIVRYNGGNPNKIKGKYRVKKILSRCYHRLFWKWAEPPVRVQYWDCIQRRRKVFEDFQKRRMTFYHHRRMAWTALKRHFPQADLYICGSDQIWNPYYKDGYNDPGYFLDFAPAGKKRIAYAPSFGCDDIPETAQSNLRYFLEKFSSVSVREKEGADIIEKYAHMKVPVLADPSLLLTKEEWNTIIRVPKDIPTQYILCYRFMKNDGMRECLDYLSEQLGLPIISLPLSDVSLADPYLKRFDAGPEDFIGLIKNATLVCTDSFHATVFSLIMNTPFYTFLDNDVAGNGRNMNSRVRNVIGIAGLENRVLGDISGIDINRILDVDFTRFNYEISEFRNESLTWLANALTEVRQ